LRQPALLSQSLQIFCQSLLDVHIGKMAAL
jgi:hypothetical protein